MRLVQENRIPRQSIPGLDGRVVDLRNSRIEQAIRSPGDEWPLAAECVRDPHAWRNILRLHRDLARVRPQRIAFQVLRRESLQIVTNAQADSEVLGSSDRVLRESCVVIRIRMTYCGAHPLYIVMTYFVSVGRQRA